MVFLKGCPLRCLWCSNPEGQKATLELEFFPARCQRCGRCIQSCSRCAINLDLDCPPSEKIIRASCGLCGDCVESCPNRALSLSGRTMTTDEVMAEIKKDLAYYRKSGGGVTLSGGDPLAQPHFARSILATCRDANIHTAVETSGYAPESNFREVVEVVELVLYDLKHIDPGEHQRLTGVSNDRILSNLRLLKEMEKPTVVRIPLIPGFNDAPDNVAATAKTVAAIGVRQVHVMPFHQLGKDKYPRLGLEYALGDLPPLIAGDLQWQGLERAMAILESEGLEVQIGG